MFHPIHSEPLREASQSVNPKWDNLTGILYTVILSWETSPITFNAFRELFEYRRGNTYMTADAKKGNDYYDHIPSN